MCQLEQELPVLTLPNCSLKPTPDRLSFTPPLYKVPLVRIFNTVHVTKCNGPFSCTAMGE